MEFQSTVFPTAEDIKLWESLSPKMQRAVITRELDEAEESGVAENVSMDELMARVRARRL